MPASSHSASDGVTVSKYEHPVCPTCQSRMLLAHIKAGSGSDQRTFECATCDHVHKVLVSNDPMKSDTLGWLFADLKPPK